MTPSSKTRLGKRKQEMQELRKEKQTITSKKHDKKCIEKTKCQEPSKSQLTILQEQYDKLKVEYEKQAETVHFLEEKVKELEKQNNHPNIVKTDKGDILMLCCECEYPAEDIFDLGEHMFEAHSNSEQDEITCKICDESFSERESLEEHELHKHGAKLSCNFCSKTFEQKNDLMMHKKEKHEEKVSACWKDTLGTCDFGDKNCWFIHNSKNLKSQFKCKVCDETFLIKSEYQQHMKIKHTSTVQLCRNMRTNEQCNYGDNCWFLHQQANFENNFETKDDVIQKIFEEMKKMTGRISQLEVNH